MRSGSEVFRSAITPGRSAREVLRDKAGASLAEGLAGVALVVLALGTLGAGIGGSIAAVNTVATKAEREALLTAIVGEKQAAVTWGTIDAPHTQTVTTPTGRDLELTTWREVSDVSTRLVAVAPSSAQIDAADCSGPAAAAKKGCLYASRLHANTLDEINPHALLRKIAGDTGVVGDIDTRVGTTDPLHQGDQVAVATDTGSTVWRYLVNAAATGTTAEIRMLQGTKILATIPLDGATHNYFGTITPEPDGPVRVVVSGGSAVISDIYLYRAGGTS